MQYQQDYCGHSFPSSTVAFTSSTS